MIVIHFLTKNKVINSFLSVSAFFNTKKPSGGVDPDEAVSYSDLVQAEIIKGTDKKNFEEILLLDVAPLSLDIETAGKIMTVLIPCNSTIPIKKSQTFTTFENIIYLLIFNMLFKLLNLYINKI